MKQLFQTPATIDNISTRADRTLKLTLSTQELPPDQAALVMSLHQKLGWFLFSENTIETDDLPKEDAVEFKQKTSPLEELNKALWLYWDRCTSKSESYGDFLRKWSQKKKIEILDLLPK